VHFVLYAGLLHVAQEEGIKELSVSIQQIPSIENGHTTIASAKAVTSDGSVLIDVGDAKHMMVLHSLAVQLNFKDEDIVKLDSLTKQQASQTITELSAKIRGQRAERSVSS
jgi:uncharacterized protein YehS (DUF1456 family)